MTSSVLTRWVLPVALIAAGVLLSAFVFYGKLPEASRVLDPRTSLVLLGTPVVAFVVLLMLRAASYGSGGQDRSTDLVIIWVVTFLFGVHAAVLATMVGMVASLRAVVPTAVGVLLLGLGPTIGSLSFGSPLGIRTASTRADPDLWRRTHRLAGGLLAAAGVSGLVGAQMGGPWALVAGVGPAVAALIVALAYGSQAPATTDEQTVPAERPSEAASVDATDA